jgi:hypothetical protein
MVYPYSESLFANKKEWNAKWKTMLRDFTYTLCPEQANL